ncbi:MAG: hypothetical protein QXF05_02255 [Thermofilaceae archaeon]
MSFVSALPAASVRFSAAAARPTYSDVGRGLDAVSAFYAVVSVVDAGTGLEVAVSLRGSLTASDAGTGVDPSCYIFLPPGPLPWDASFVYGLPNLLPTFMGAVLPPWVPRKVNPRDIIQPWDHNVFILFWQQVVSQLEALRSAIAERVPDRVDEYDAAVDLMRAYVSRMPTVEKGDDVFSEHFNVKLDMVDLFLSIADFIVNTVLGSPEDLVELLEGIMEARLKLVRKWAGDIIASSDHNTLVDIAIASIDLLKKVRLRLT